MFPRSVQKTVRLYRNRLSAWWSPGAVEAGGRHHGRHNHSPGHNTGHSQQSSGSGFYKNRGHHSTNSMSDDDGYYVASSSHRRGGYYDNDSDYYYDDDDEYEDEREEDVYNEVEQQAYHSRKHARERYNRSQAMTQGQGQGQGQMRSSSSKRKLRRYNRTKGKGGKGWWWRVRLMTSPFFLTFCFLTLVCAVLFAFNAIGQQHQHQHHQNQRHGGRATLRALLHPVRAMKDATHGSGRGDEAVGKNGGHAYHDDGVSTNEKKYDPMHASDLLPDTGGGVKRAQVGSLSMSAFVPSSDKSVTLPSSSTSTSTSTSILSSSSSSSVLSNGGDVGVAVTYDNDTNTRTCYTNGISHAGVCVHSPLCVRHSTITYIARTLRCAAYVTSDGRVATQSASGCSELEKRIEQGAYMTHVEYKPSSWVTSLREHDNLLMFDNGDSVLLRLPARAATSLPFFMKRVFMVQHVARHAARYGLHAGLRYVIVDAHRDVARKLKYSKSWHHGLLRAAVHPSTPIYSYGRLRDAVNDKQRRGSGNDLIVYVTSGEWELGKSRYIPCFQRVALLSPPPADGLLFMPRHAFPGTSSSSSSLLGEHEYDDASYFRQSLLESLLTSGTVARDCGVPASDFVYLHRGTTRTFDTASLSTFQAVVSAVAAAHGLRYRLVDASALPFARQVCAVAGAAVVVGVHGAQMLNGLFVSNGSVVVEVFPYRMVTDAVPGRSTGARYERYSVAKGEEYEGLQRWYGGDAERCQKEDAACRHFYMSDERAIEFGRRDAQSMSILLQQAVQHVKTVSG